MAGSPTPLRPLAWGPCLQASSAPRRAAHKKLAHRNDRRLVSL